jgi:P4 family phage/plasmid primase-like protien
MTTAALSTPKEYAYYYRDVLGFSIVVLKTEPARKRKEPAVLSLDRYLKRKPTDEEIEQWFTINPNYNLGIPMGQVSQAIAFDVDGQNGVKRMESKIPEMSSNLREALANTMKTRTGNGGEHIIFKIEGDIEHITKKIVWSDGQPHSQILMLANDNYVVAAPSQHPNGERYEWNGKTPSTIALQELNEFVRLISSQGTTVQSRPQTEISKQVEDVPPQVRTLTSEQMDQMLLWIKPYYIPGDRDWIIFYLSGMMRKDAGFSLETARTFIKLLCTESTYSDEDVDKSLTVVDNTYRKPLNELNGKSGLHDLLVKSHEGSYSNEEYLARADAYSRICQVINGEPTTTPETTDDNKNKNDNKDKSSFNETEMLIKEKVDEDQNTKIISYLSVEVMKRVAIKTLFDTQQILYYDTGRNKHFRFGGDSIIDAEIEKIVKEIGAPYTIRSYIKGEVQKCIADNTLVHRDEFDADPYSINLENCLLDIIELKEIEHSPEHLTMMSKFPIAYDPTIADCPRIEKFLAEVIQDPYKLKEVLKFWAYVLIKDCRYEKALMLLGGGSNGKSVLIKLFEAAVGKDNCCHLSLHELEEDRFGRARLFGKTLNTYADNKSQRLKETGNLKTAISGDSIEGQEKFKPRFTFRNRAKIIVSTNNPPETEDKTHAFYRRWLVVTFDRTFAKSEDPNDPNKKDTELIDKLTTPRELSGFLNLGLRYLQVLFKENGFAEEPIDKVKREYEFKADHVSKYLQEYSIIDSTKKDYMTKTSELYQHYVRVCKEILQVRELDENVFGSKLMEHGILKKRRRIKKKSEGGGMEYVYEPIVLKHKLQQEQDSILQGNDSGLLGAVEGATIPIGVVAEEQPETSSIVECPYCALENEAGNAPLFQSENLREVQIHMVLKHPGLDFEEIGAEG